MREKVYQKARSTVAAKLAAISPPPPAAVAERQKRALDEAIVEVESSYAGGGRGSVRRARERVCRSRDRRRTGQPRDRRRCLRDPMSIRGHGRAALPNRTRRSKLWPISGLSVPFDGEDEDEDGEGEYERSERRRNFAPLIAAVVALVGAGRRRLRRLAEQGRFQGDARHRRRSDVGQRAGGRRPDRACGSQEDRQRCQCGRRGRRKVHAAAEQRRLGNRCRPGRRHRLAWRRHVGRLGDAAASAGRPGRGDLNPRSGTAGGSRCRHLRGSRRSCGCQHGSRPTAAAATAAGDTDRGRGSRRRHHPRRQRQPIPPAPCHGNRYRGSGSDSTRRLRCTATAEPATCRGGRAALAPLRLQPVRRPRPPTSSAVAVGQKAIFYEERTNVAEGSAEVGTHRLVAGAAIARQRPAAGAGDPRRGDDPRQGPDR